MHSHDCKQIHIQTQLSAMRRLMWWRHCSWCKSASKWRQVTSTPGRSRILTSFGIHDFKQVSIVLTKCMTALELNTGDLGQGYFFSELFHKSCFPSVCLVGIVGSSRAGTDNQISCRVWCLELHDSWAPGNSMGFHRAIAALGEMSQIFQRLLN